MTVFNVKEYGATGKKQDDAGPAIQKAIDAAAAAGGGVVYLPPGEYTSGTLRLRSHVNIYIESGATLFASEDPAAFDSQKVKSKDALFFGEDLEDISIGGRGTVDGQAKYFWAPDTIERSFLHKKLIVAIGQIADAFLSCRQRDAYGLSSLDLAGTIEEREYHGRVLRPFIQLDLRFL